jgi:LPXTG-motif cell wall-anchored protein
MLAATVAALLTGPAAAAQVVVPGGGDVDINQRGRTERTERTPGTGRTPGSPRVESTQGRTERTPGTGRTPGRARIPRPGAPEGARRLPTTGTTATTMALDAVTLLGGGLVLLRYRRRIVA